MTSQLSRRQILQSSVCIGAGALATLPAVAAPTQKQSQSPGGGPFRFCLNTGTISGFKLPLTEEVEITAKAGYQGIEPWLPAIQKHVQDGKSLADLRRRIADAGLAVENAIGFAQWIIDDDAQRAKGLEQMKRDMDLVAQLGGHHIAAPPAGANNIAGMDLRKIGQRYRAVLELGKQTGVSPLLEIWGHSKTLSRMSEGAMVAIEAGHPDASLLLDIFHIYKSGCDFAGLRQLNGRALHVLHVNDYPAKPPRETATDADRVYPGDGVAPLKTIFRDLRDIGFQGALSLEVFNRQYWKGDALTVARTGLEKTKAAVKSALEG
jgi:2-keto-myo-inositol isomerase